MSDSENKGSRTPKEVKDSENKGSRTPKIVFVEKEKTKSFLTSAKDKTVAFATNEWTIRGACLVGGIVLGVGAAKLKDRFVVMDTGSPDSEVEAHIEDQVNEILNEDAAVAA